MMEQLHSEKNRTFYIKNINDYCERMHPTQKKRFLICFHLHKIERKNSIGTEKKKKLHRMKVIKWKKKHLSCLLQFHELNGKLITLKHPPLHGVPSSPARFQFDNNKYAFSQANKMLRLFIRIFT